MRLGHAAIQLSGDPALGLQMGRLSRLGQMGLAGVSVAQAPNLRAAARAMIHLEPLYAQNYRGQSRPGGRRRRRLAALLFDQPL